MYAVKGVLVGQTFALTKSSEYEGRKTRIRRSKEERKQMVESFIKKYQSLNNGNFPSLNLTHKEVGGSFYTVREIVREVIQENRVLGPGKMLPHEENSEQILEECSLGTIATESCTSLSISPNGSVIPNQQQSTIEEPDIVVDELFAEPGLHCDDKGKLINGSHITVECEQSNKPKAVEVLVNEVLESERYVENLASTKVAKMADVAVETFPIRPVASPTSRLDENSIAIGNLNGTSEEEEKDEKVYPTVGDDSILPNRTSLSGSGGVKSRKDPLLHTTSNLVDGKAEEDVADPLVFISNSPTIEDGMANDFVLDINMKVKLSDNDGEVAENKDAGPPSDIHAKTANGAHTTLIGSNSKYHDEVEKKPEVRQSDSHLNGSNETLNRINLSRAWEGESRNSSKPEANPLWAFVKSFVDAFVKFWSE